MFVYGELLSLSPTTWPEPAGRSETSQREENVEHRYWILDCYGFASVSTFSEVGMPATETQRTKKVHH